MDSKKLLMVVAGKKTKTSLLFTYYRQKGREREKGLRANKVDRDRKGSCVCVIVRMERRFYRERVILCQQSQSNVAPKR